MKGLKKLILASAITAASTSAFAMQALDDDTMSNTTGQDGLTITLGTDVTIGALRIHDKDGLKDSGVPAAFDSYFLTDAATNDTDGTVSGSIVINGPIGIKDATTTAGTTLKIDAGATTAGGAPVLHIGVTTSDQIISLGGVTIGVASGNGLNLVDAGNAPLAATSTTATILSFDAGTTLDVSGTTLNIDLGNQPNGSLVWGTNTMTAKATVATTTDNWKLGTVVALSSLNILQGANGIGLANVTVKPNAGNAVANQITQTLSVSVVASGLQIGLNSTDGMDIAVGDIRLGSNYTVASAGASIGTVYIDNLKTGNQTITIAGH